MVYLLVLLGAIGIIVFNFYSVGLVSGVLVLILCCHISAKLYTVTTRKKLYFGGDGVFFVLTVVTLGHIFMEEDLKTQFFTGSNLILLFTGLFLVWLERKPNREYLESKVDFPILNGKALQLVDIWDSKYMFMAKKEEKPTYITTIQWLSGLSTLPKEVRRYLRAQNRTLETLRDILVDAHVHRVDISLENRLHMLHTFSTILDRLHQFHVDLDPEGEIYRGKKQEQFNKEFAERLKNSKN